MKRFACVVGAALGFALCHSADAHAQWPGAMGGEEKSAPPLNKLFGHRTDGKKWTAEEERLQMFWRDYYRSLRDYYASLESVDWVAYYKKNGYPIDPAFYNPNGINPAGGTVPVPVMPGMTGMQGVTMMPKGMAADGTMIMQAGCSDCQTCKPAKGSTPAKKQ
jgi:hypothetical protein